MNSRETSVASIAEILYCSFVKFNVDVNNILFPKDFICLFKAVFPS